MTESPNSTLPSKTTRARPYRMSLHWDAREQSLQSYSATTLDVLDFLTARSEVFERWFIRGETLTPLEGDRVQQLTLALEANRKTWEFNGVDYSGDPATLSNGRRGSRQLELHLTYGIRIPSAGIWFANQVHVELFGPSDGFPDLGSSRLWWNDCSKISSQLGRRCSRRTLPTGASKSSITAYRTSAGTPFSHRNRSMVRCPRSMSQSEPCLRGSGSCAASIPGSTIRIRSISSAEKERRMPSQAQDYCVPAFDVGAASTQWRRVALSFVTS